MTDIIAHLRHCPASPRKMRLVADLLRGKNISEAEVALRFTEKRAAAFLAKLLRSAVANAEHNFSLPKEKLRIKRITVDDGPILKRYLPRARGRATPLRRRRSHVTVVLSEQQKNAAKSDLAASSVRKKGK